MKLKDMVWKALVPVPFLFAFTMGEVAADTPQSIPAFARFDDASEWRLYPARDVAKGQLVITMVNRHSSDGIVFEQWRTSSGHTFAQHLAGGGSSTTNVPLDYIQRLVWVGHYDIQINKALDGETGWRLDWTRTR